MDSGERTDRLARVAGRVHPAASELLAVVRGTGLTFLAAAIAYYAFVSAVPLALLALAVASALGGPALADAVVGLVDEALTPAASDPLRTALVDGAGRGPATAVGLLTLVWGALRVFRGLNRAFSRVYGTAGPDSLLAEVRDAAVALGAGGVGVVAVAAAQFAFVGVVGGPLAAVAGALALPGTLTAAFLPLYLTFPNADVGLRGALPGAVGAALGWTVLGTTFGAYTAVAGSFALYGVLGAALLLATYLYFGAVLLLGGAALNAVLSGHAG